MDCNFETLLRCFTSMFFGFFIFPILMTSFYNALLDFDIGKIDWFG